MKIERRTIVVQVKRKRRGRSKPPAAYQTDLIFAGTAIPALAYGRLAIGKSEPIEKDGNAEKFLRENPSKINQRSADI